MGLFRFAKGLGRTAVDLALVPVEVTKDFMTMGGVITGRRRTYTGERLEQVGRDLDSLPDRLDD